MFGVYSSYNGAMKAECSDNNHTSVHKQGGSTCYRGWQCYIQVLATTEDQGDFIKERRGPFLRDIKHDKYNPDQVTPHCRADIRSENYTCYIEEDEQELLKCNENCELPTYVLVLFLVFTSLCSLASCGWCCYYLFAGSTAVQTNEDNEPKLASKPTVKLNQVAVQMSKEDEALQKAASGCRKLTLDDLCPELIPGLLLRVLCFKRWHSAYALNYSIENQTVTVAFRDPTIIARYLSSRKSVHSIKDGTIRLHEDALCYRARQKIFAGLLRAYLSGATFQSLDSDGNGKLSHAEIMEGLQRHGVKLDGAEVQALIAVLIAEDGDDKIDAKDFRTFLSNNLNLVA